MLGFRQPYDSLGEALRFRGKRDRLILEKQRLRGQRKVGSMIWSDFYDNHMDWAESTIRSRISSLEDIGSGDEVVDAILYLPSEKLKAQLIRKAMKLQAEFTHDDFMNLDGELPDELYRELAAYGGFDADNPYFDEDNMTWDDFYSEYYNWSEKDILRRIQKLKEFGSPEDVCDVVCGMVDYGCQEALYEKAVKAGIKFTGSQLEDMGYDSADGEDFLDLNLESQFTDADMAELEANIEILCNNLDQLYPPQPPRKKPGFFGILFAILGAFAGAGGDKKKDTGRCDGDCANCPPHYGYRYGRWYYGKGHRYGCERGGNGGI